MDSQRTYFIGKNDNDDIDNIIMMNVISRPNRSIKFLPPSTMVALLHSSDLFATWHGTTKASDLFLGEKQGGTPNGRSEVLLRLMFSIKKKEQLKTMYLGVKVHVFARWLSICWTKVHSFSHFGMFNLRRSRLF